LLPANVETFVGKSSLAIVDCGGFTSEEQGL
jgi:hypothetical protein